MYTRARLWVDRVPAAERNGIRSMVVLRELMSGPLRADIMVSFGKPARPSGCAGSKQGQRAAGGRTPLDGRHLDRPEPVVSLPPSLAPSSHSAL